jgi:hypothetical protein
MGPYVFTVMMELYGVDLWFVAWTLLFGAGVLWTKLFVKFTLLYKQENVIDVSCIQVVDNVGADMVVRVARDGSEFKDLALEREHVSNERIPRNRRRSPAFWRRFRALRSRSRSKGVKALSSRRTLGSTLKLCFTTKSQVNGFRVYGVETTSVSRSRYADYSFRLLDANGLKSRILEPRMPVAEPVKSGGGSSFPLAGLVSSTAIQRDLRADPSSHLRAFDVDHIVRHLAEQARSWDIQGQAEATDKSETGKRERRNGKAEEMGTGVTEGNVMDQAPATGATGAGEFKGSMSPTTASLPANLRWPCSPTRATARTTASATVLASPQSRWATARPSSRSSRSAWALSAAATARWPRSRATAGGDAMRTISF